MQRYGVSLDVAVQTEWTRRLRSRAWWKANGVRVAPWGFILLLALSAGVAWLVSGDFRAEVQELAHVLKSGDQGKIRTYLRGYGALGPFVSVFLMVLQVLVAPIPASVVQLANGVVYGKVGGTLLNFVGQMIGAVVAFWIARSFGEGTVEKLAGKVNRDGGGVESWLQTWGGKALFVIRAVPGMPSDFMSYVAGLTRMSFRTYIVSTALGFIPQSILYAWLGDTAVGYFWWVVLAGFGISGVIALVVWLMNKK